MTKKGFKTISTIVIILIVVVSAYSFGKYTITYLWEVMMHIKLEILIFSIRFISVLLILIFRT